MEDNSIGLINDEGEIATIKLSLSNFDALKGDKKDILPSYPLSTNYSQKSSQLAEPTL